MGFGVRTRVPVVFWVIETAKQRPSLTEGRRSGEVTRTFPTAHMLIPVYDTEPHGRWWSTTSPTHTSLYKDPL